MRRILVSSNCQTFGLTASLQAMLRDDVVVGQPWVGDDVSDNDLGRELANADVWVTSADGEAAAELERGTSASIVRIPRVLFGAFQPDTVYAKGPEGDWLASPVARMHSAIVLWGWRHRLEADDIVELFTPAVMHGLGYTTGWPGEVDRLRDIVERTDIEFSTFFLPLTSGSPFMLTVNHPRIAVLIQIALQVARQLGADGSALDFPWESIVPDRPLTNGPVWPIYPSVAEALDVRGGFIWRSPQGRLYRLDEFVRESLDRYAPFAASDIVAPALDDPRFDAVLGGAR